MVVYFQGYEGSLIKLTSKQPVGFVSFDSRSEAEAAKNALNVSSRDGVTGGFPCEVVGGDGTSWDWKSSGKPAQSDGEGFVNLINPLKRFS